MIEHLWSQAGRKAIAFKAEKGIGHKWFDSYSEAEGFIKWCQKKGMDTWFSCAVFSTDSRKQKNVSSISGFWIDLDCGPDKDYDTQKDALTALRDFCKEVKLPKPTLINSGYGIHCYWLTEPMDPETWGPRAAGLKQLCIDKGLRIDKTRTADSASIMRIPGTSNFKKDSKVPVAVIATSEVVKLDLPEVEAKTRKAKKKSVNDILSTQSAYPPSDANNVADKCRVIGKFKDTQGNVDEPYWYAALSVISHCEGGRDIAHEWSAGHPGYDAGETDTKLEQLQDYGPTTCAKFHEDIAPATCRSCPMFEKITSPIQLGAIVTAIEPEDAQEGTVIEDAPRPTLVGDCWQIGAEGVLYNPSDDPPVMILNVPLYIDRLNRIGSKDTVAVITWRTKAGNWRTSDMSLSIIGEGRALREWLLKNSITGGWSGKEKFVMKYLIDFATDMQEDKDPDIVAEQFGWGSQASFYIGDREVTKSRVTKTRPAGSIPQSMVTGLRSEGKMSDWIEATEIYSNPQYVHHAFAILTSLAAPVLKLMNVPGAVLSLAGPSGTGKTTSLRFALSVWGHSDALLMGPDSTAVAKDAMMRSANNLPVGIDDISGKHSKALGGLMYMAANGKAKERGNVAGNLKEQATWQTITIISTNNPVMDLPENLLAEAERRRVLELPVVDMISRLEAGKIHNLMRNTYGCVADAYIQALIANQEKVAAVADKMWHEYSNDPNIPDQNRFGVWLCASAYAAGKMAYAKGLIRFDPVPVVDAALQVLKDVKDSLISDTDLIHEEIAEFQNTHFNKITIHSGSSWLNMDSIRGEVVARMDRDLNKMYIPISRLKKWINDRNIPSTALNTWVKEENIERKNTVLAPRDYGGASVRCYVIPTYQGD